MAALAALVALLLSGCGDSDEDGEETPFGSLAEVRTYRDQINPLITQVSAMEATVQETAVGTANAATAENLNSVYVEVRPQLLEVLADFDRIEPPAALVSLHDEIRQLIVLRLDAYGLVMEGFSTQDATLYPIAEEKLAAANALIPAINLQLCDIDVALDDREDCRLVA